MCLDVDVSNIAYFSEIGFGGDEVFCFWCGGTLAMWEELDVPMVEHAKHFPDCKFINDVYLSKLRGDYYNLNIKDKQASIKPIQ